MALAGQASSFTADLKCHNDAQCAVRGAVLFRSVSDASVVNRVAIQSSSAVIAGPTGSQWDVSLEAPGFWAPWLRVTLPPDGEGKEPLNVWRTGRVRLTLKSPDGMPDGARIVVASPPDPLRSPQILPGTYFDCTAAGEADRWNCDVPATLLDLSVRGKGGYTPHYRWDVNVTSDGILDLGTVTLRKGASILAWLDSTFAKRVEQPVRASVRHRGAADLTPAAVRLATPVAEAVFTKAGFVQLGALAPGRYVLDVQSKGYAPIQIPVEVLEGRESVLKQTIELSRSASVTLRLLPPLGPEEAPWRVDLIRKTDFGTGSEPAGGGVASREGIFQAQEQAEGPLRVVVLDDKGNVYANREIDVPAGGGEQILALDVIAVTGTVKLGEEALPHASLLFGGSGGKERVNAVADGEGRFHAILPRRGEWRVDVEAAAEAVAATAEVSVGEDTKELEIELPSTEISGWVRGATGERSGSAEVMLLTGGRPMRRPSESDGTFRFRGVPAGEIRLSARDTKTGEYSGTVTTAVSEDAIKDGIELRIEGLNSVRGVVRSGGHPVIGARVIGYAFIGDSAKQERTVTDMNGGFTLQIPASAREMDLAVAALGSIFHPFKIPDPLDPIVLDIAARGGELYLRWPSGVIQPRVVFNNVPVTVQDLFEWERVNGRKHEARTLRVPDMAPGRYQFCAAARCIEGVLATGGRLELEVAE
jgi:hypothetical protein